MTGRRAEDGVGGRTDGRLESRLDEVRRLLRDHHARIEPDPHFVTRVMARLPRDASWSITWAARRILPVSLACAMVLTLALLAGGRAATTATASGAASVSASAASAGAGDPLEWLLESRGEYR